MTPSTDREKLIERLTIAKSQGEHSIASGVSSDYATGVDTFRRLAWTHREAILEALSQGWRSIDTAPKDGTEVIVLLRPKVIRLGWYFAPSSRTFGWCDENGRRIKPTHWMPLPTPPTEEQ